MSFSPRAPLLLSLLLLPSASAFFPYLADPATGAKTTPKRGEGCNGIKKFLQTLHVDSGGSSFGGGGSIGLSGGLEFAVEEDLCDRLLAPKGYRPGSDDFDVACKDIHEAVKDATGFWADRHPDLYFNWTSPIHDTAAAEIVVSANWASGGSGRSVIRVVGGQQIITLNPSKCFLFKQPSNVCDALEKQGTATHFAAFVALASLAVWALVNVLKNGVKVRVPKTERVERQKTAKGLCEEVKTALLNEAGRTPRLRDFARRLGESENVDRAQDQGWEIGDGVFVEDSNDIMRNGQFAVVIGRPAAAAANVKVDADADADVDADADADTDAPVSPLLIIEWVDKSFGIAPYHKLVDPSNLRSPTVDELADKMKVPKTTVVQVPTGHFSFHFSALIWPLVFLASSAAIIPSIASIAACQSHILSTVSAQSKTENCYLLRGLLAKHIGQVLGIDIADGAYRLDNNANASTADYIPIDAKDVCSGLDVYKQKDCMDFAEDAAKCNDHYYCKFTSGGHCASIFDDALMHSGSGYYYASAVLGGKNTPTEDDLAALFFLYPSSKRRSSWGTFPLPLKEYSVQKLKCICEDEFGGQCASLNVKASILNCLQAKMVEDTIAEVDKMVSSNCASKLDSNCGSLGSLRRSMTAALRYIRGVHGSSGAASGDTGKHGEDLDAARRESEGALDDGTTAATTNVDDIINALLNADDGDLNDDGVIDADRDRDGLPDVVEDGLDVLKELLEEIRSSTVNGKYTGTGIGKDVDFDGIPDEEDEDNRNSCDVEGGKNSESVFCNKW